MYTIGSISNQLNINGCAQPSLCDSTDINLRPHDKAVQATATLLRSFGSVSCIVVNAAGFPEQTLGVFFLQCAGELMPESDSINQTN